MSVLPAVTMQDLELEHAELFPSRETLWVCHPSRSGGFTQVGYGNTAGLVNLAVGNGSFNILSLGSGNIE